MKKIILTKKLAFLYKFSIVAGLAMLPLLIIVSLCLDIFFADSSFIDKVSYVLFCIILSLTMFLGCIVFIFPFVVEDSNGVMEMKTRADKYAVKIDSFNSFLDVLEDSIAKNNFSKIQEQVLNNYSMFLYTSKLKRSNLDVILIIRAETLTSHIIDDSNELYVKFLESHFERDFRKISNYISVMTLVCVDRTNSIFKKVVDSNLEQDFGISRFISGLSFGRKSLYVAKQKGGFAVLKYRKLRKKFFELFGFLIN